jgi:hypothetical protein
MQCPISCTEGTNFICMRYQSDDLQAERQGAQHAGLSREIQPREVIEPTSTRAIT